MITIDRVSKRKGRAQILHDVTFEARPGRVTGFLGQNGAGKTSTLRVLLGLDRPQRGTALICGRAYHDLHRPLTTVGALLDGSGAHRARTGPRAPALGRRQQRPARLPRPGGPRRRRPRRRRPQTRRPLLPRHEPPARARRRAARRSRGPRPRRACQRPRPGRHPVDAGVPARPGHPGPHRAAVQPPHGRAGRDRRRRRRHPPGPDRGPGRARRRHRRARHARGRVLRPDRDRDGTGGSW